MTASKKIIIAAANNLNLTISFIALNKPYYPIIFTFNQPGFSGRRCQSRLPTRLLRRRRQHQRRECRRA